VSMNANEKHEERISRMYDNAKAILTRVLDREDDLNEARDVMNTKIAEEYYNITLVAKSHPFAISKPVFQLLNPIYSLINTYYDSLDTEYVDDELMTQFGDDILRLIRRVMNKISEVEYALELQRGIRIEDSAMPVADEARTLAKKAGLLDALRGKFTKKEAVEDVARDHEESGYKDDGTDFA